MKETKKEQTKRLIALCTSRIYDPQVHGFIESLNESLQKENCALLVYTTNSDLYWNDENITAEAAVFDLVPYDTIEVVIVMDEKIKSHKVTRRIINQAEEHDKPVIIIDGHYDGSYHIHFDYAAGFEQVVRHVMETGRVKRPHLMAGIPNNPFSEERIRIFKNVIREYKIKFSEAMVSYGYFWAVPARDETEKIIASGILPDAIICGNDIMAINVCDVLQQHGIRVPEEILVSGFDGYNEAFVTSPKITTVRCSTPDLADAAFEMILKIINKKSGKLNPETRLVLPELIPNESTGDPSNSGYDHAMLNRFNNSFYRHQDSVRLMYEAATGMQTSKDPDEMVSYLDKLVVNEQDVLRDVSFAVNRNIFNSDNYFFDDSDPSTKVTDYSMVFDPSVKNGFFEIPVEESRMVPENQRFWKKIESGYPLIFNTIDYMNTPLGVICYNYDNYDITKYSRTANVTNTISMGIGGYVNMNYQRSLADKVENLYKKDTLTGLYNRIGFLSAFETILNDKEKWGQPVTVIMSDLDNLKTINDNFGHAEGDIAITMVASAMKMACPEKALCVRFGGDEIFSVIIGECNIEEIIGKVNDILKEYNKVSQKEYKVEASSGYAEAVLDESFEIKTALRIADEQMYTNKKKHRRRSTKSARTTKTSQK